MAANTNTTRRQQGIAQSEREARADHSLDQRGIGREARQDFSGLRGLEELRTHAHDVIVDRAPQIGRHPFAQPRDPVKAQRRRTGEDERDDKKPDEIAIDMGPVAACEAAVDQVSERHRQRQCRARRCHESQERERPAPGVRPQERDEGEQRANAWSGGGGSRHGIA
ncbi:hypothetical protein NK8_50200 [Caballeronia sp. NK8]|nr:hypothetical protein NK8_50200 [Caballeronia sp. NK8]